MSKRVELAISVALTIFGLIYLHLAMGITQSVKNDPIGERGLPYALGTFFVLGGCVLSLRVILAARADGWLAPRENDLNTEPGDEPEYAASSVRPLVMWAVFAVWALTVSRIGFLLATPVVLAIELWLLWFRRPARLVALSVLGTAFLWIVFDYLLQIDLPAGYLEPLTSGWQL